MAKRKLWIQSVHGNLPFPGAHIASRMKMKDEERSREKRLYVISYTGSIGKSICIVHLFGGRDPDTQTEPDVESRAKRLKLNACTSSQECQMLGGATNNHPAATEPTVTLPFLSCNLRQCIDIFVTPLTPPPLLPSAPQRRRGRG